MKLYVFITGVLLTLSLLLVACGESAAPTPEATVTPPATVTPVPIPNARPTPTTAAAPTVRDTPTPTSSYRLTILHNNNRALISGPREGSRGTVDVMSAYALEHAGDSILGAPPQ